MKKILTILLLMLSFNVMSQDNPKLIYSDTLHCKGSCLDECNYVKVCVELYLHDESYGYIRLSNLDNNSDEFNKMTQFNIKKFVIYDDDSGFYIVPWKNEKKVKYFMFNNTI